VHDSTSWAVSSSWSRLGGWKKINRPLKIRTMDTSKPTRRGVEMDLTAAMCAWLQETADAFHGAQRRQFMAKTVEALALSQRQAEQQLGWARDTIRKAQHELRSGIACVDNFSARGRKPAEFHLPHLFHDIRDVVQDHIQTDATFQTTRLYCRLSAPEVRKQLIESKGYADEQLPSERTIADKLNFLGFRLRTVVKNRPQKN
jgi:hypothetical protein